MENEYKESEMWKTRLCLNLLPEAKRDFGTASFSHKSQTHVSYHSSLSHLPTAHLEVVTIMMFSRLLGSGSGKDLSEGKKRWTCLT